MWGCQGYNFNFGLAIRGVEVSTHLRGSKGVILASFDLGGGGGGRGVYNLSIIYNFGGWSLANLSYLNRSKINTPP